MLEIKDKHDQVAQCFELIPPEAGVADLEEEEIARRMMRHDVKSRKFVGDPTDD